MGLLGKLRGKEKVSFPSSKDVERAEDKADREEQKRLEREAYKLEFNRARIERKRKMGREAGSVTFSDRLEKFAGNVGSSSAPHNHPPSVRRYSTRGNANPFGSMFDSGISYGGPKPIRSHGSHVNAKKYAIVAGKAYPIGGMKGKKKRRSSGGGGRSFDMFDNWGYMK